VRTTIDEQEETMTMSHNAAVPPPRITVWNEFWYEKHDPNVARIYPEGIHMALAKPLRAAGFPVRTATLDDPEHGLDEVVLAETDVLVWWGHKRHDEVSDAVVARVRDRVLGGMGLVALHSSHFSKLFKALMGTTCTLNWRVDGQKERLWVVEPGHPIAAGLPAHFELPEEEAYGEFFDIPEPDALVLISWFRGGEVFRSGCCFSRGRGRVFYFRPGHETFPTYHDPVVQKVIANAARWSAPSPGERQVPVSVCTEALETF
jgi:trehalose utilization protein